MRIAIVGYGRMGREVEAVAVDRGHEVVLRVDPLLADDPAARPRTACAVSEDALSGVDVAVEFSHAGGVVENVRAYCSAGVPAVVGTTGWSERVADVEALVAGSSVGVVHGSNFSIGAHVFFHVSAYAASLVRELPEYDLLVHEIHHRGKKDSPSGTALTLARRVLDACPRKARMETARLDRAPEPDELHVSSSRGGAFAGTHSLYLDSIADTVEITHRARNRSGFALGAVRAAEWVVGRRGLHTVESFIEELLKL